MKAVRLHKYHQQPVIEEVPEPLARAGWVVVRNRYSLISSGTEREKIDLGRKGLLSKARSRPDLVRKVIARARVEGPAVALSVARDRLAALAPLGYSSAGLVCVRGRLWGTITSSTFSLSGSMTSAGTWSKKV